MKIQIIQTLSNGQIKQQTLSKEGADVVQTQIQGGGKLAVQVERLPSAEPITTKSKPGAVKKIGNDLVLELNGEPMVEVPDFFSNAAASIHDVSWNYAQLDLPETATSPSPDLQPVVSSDSLRFIPESWMVPAGVSTVATLASLARKESSATEPAPEKIPPLNLVFSADSGNTSSQVGGLTHEKVLNFQGLEPGARWEYQVDGGEWKAGTGTSLALEEGSHTYSIRQLDAAGHVIGVSEQQTYNRDTLPPSAPTLSVEGGDTAGLTHVPAANLSGLEPGASWEYQVDNGAWTAGTGTTLTLLAGSHTYSVRQTDAAGNQSVASDQQTFDLDNVPPEAPGFLLVTDSGNDGADSVTNIATVNVSDLEPGATWEYQVDYGGWTAGVGTSFALSAGLHNYSVRQTDAVGNTSVASEAKPFTLDTTANAPSLALATDSGNDGSDSVTNIATVNVNGLEPGATWEYQVDNGSWTTGVGTSFTLTAGNHNYSVRQTDAAGNTSLGSQAKSFTLDTTASAPSLSLATDSGNDGADGLTQIATVNVDGLEDGATWEYQVDNGSWTTGVGTSFTLSAGLHNYSVRQTDTAGNASVASEAKPFTLDTTANAPSLALATDSGNDGADGLTNIASVNVNGLEDGATWEYQVDNGSWTAGVGSSFTLTAGNHNYSVRQTDAAGNTSLASEIKPFTLDTTVSTPSLSLATDSGNDGADGVTQIATVNVDGLEDGATWEYQVDNGSWTSGVGSSFTLTAGNHNYSVRQTDAVGNTSLASEAKPFTLDTTANAPSLALATDSGNDGADSLTNTATVNVNGLEDGATWEYQVDNGSWTAGVGTSFTLSAGTHNYSVRQTDAAGNTSLASEAKPFTLDTTASPPSLALATDSGNDGADGLTNIATVNVNGLEPGATWEYQVDNGSWTAGVGTSFTLSAGLHTYSVRQTDPAGNKSLASEVKPFTLDTAASAPSLSLATDSGNDVADGLTRIATVNVDGLEDGATWEYQVDSGSWTAGVGTSFALSADAHNYSVRQTDASGNTSLASEAKPFTLDTTVSTPSLSLATDSGNDGSDSVTNIATVNVDGLEDGATWEYQVDNGSWTAGVGTSFALTAGTHHYSVRQTDAAGNMSAASGPQTYGFDAVNPSAPQVSLTTELGSVDVDGLTNASAVHVIGLEDGATWAYQVDDGEWLAGVGTTLTLHAGPHTYSVRQTDAAGNLSDPSEPKSYTLDATVNAPSLNLDTDSGSGDPDGVTNIANVSVSGLEDGATWEYQVDDGEWTAGVGTSFTLSSGLHTYSVRQTDAAGNTSLVSETKTFTLDTTASAPSLALATDSGNDGADGLTRIATVNVNGLEDGATWEYQVDDGAWNAGVGTSFNLTAGNHTYSVRQTDPADNASLASDPKTFTLDTSVIAPSLSLTTDSGNDDADGVTHFATVTVSGLDDGATWAYQVDDGEWLAGVGTTLTLHAGPHTYSVRQTDAAGNLSDASDSKTYTYDTTANPPTLSLATDSGHDGADGITNIATVNVNGIEDGATWEYQVDNGSWSPGVGTSFSLSVGQHTYSVRQTDAAGNLSVASEQTSFTLVIAASAPSLVLSTDSGEDDSDGITHIATVNVSGLEDGATWEYQVDNGSWTAGVGTSFALSTGLHNYSVRQTDITGNTSLASVAKPFTLDATASAPSLVLATDSGNDEADGITHIATVNVNGLEDGATWEYQVDNGNWTAGVGHSFHLSAGLHSYSVRQTDVSGNTSLASETKSFTLDTTVNAPNLSLATDSGNDGADGLTRIATVNVNGLEEGATWDYQIDNGNWTAGVGTSFTLSVGQHTYSVRQTDAAGNLSVASEQMPFTLDATATAPTLSRSPDIGNVDNGGLTNVTAVNVLGLENGASWQYQVDDGEWTTGAGTQLSLLAGLHTYSVRQTDAAGNPSASSDPKTYDFDTLNPLAPSLSLSPDIGSADSGGLTNLSLVHVQELEDGATWEYQVDNGSWTAGLGASFTLSAGSHTYSVRQTDAAGNLGVQSEPKTYTLDTTAMAPTLSRSTEIGSVDNGGLTNVTAVNVLGLENGASWQYQIDDGEWTTGAGTQLSLLAGLHTYSLRQTDAAGNTSLPSIQQTYDLDLVLPQAPSLSLSEQDGGIVHVNGLESNQSWEYQVDDGEWTVGSDNTLALLAGLHTYVVRQTDAAGNLSHESEPNTFNLDAEPPSAPGLSRATELVSSDPGGLTNLSAVNVIGLEPGASWEYQVDSGEWTAGTGTTLALLTGQHVYSVRQTDTAGNRSVASDQKTYDLDNVRPDAPGVLLATDSGNDGADSVTQIATVNVNGLEDGATWEYQVDNGSWTTGVGTSFALSAGAHNYSVRQTDAAGNTSLASEAKPFTLDTTASAPSLSLATDSGNDEADSVTNIATVNVNGLEDGATWEYQVDNGSWTTGVGTSFNLSAGLHNYSVRQTDAAGNTSLGSQTKPFTLDTTASAPSLSLATDSGNDGADGLTRIATVNVNGLEPGATWEYKVDSGSWTTGVGTSFALSAGLHNYSVRQTDAVGNTSLASEAKPFTLDITAIAPSLSLATDSGNDGSDSVTNIATVNVDGLEDGATWEYQVDNGSWTAGVGTSFTLSAGAHNYSVRQTDAAGNTSLASEAKPFTLDTTASAPSLSLATDSGNDGSDSVTNIAMVNVNGLEDGATWEYQVDNGSWTTGVGTSFTLSAGTHNYSVRQTDAVGNTSLASQTKPFTLDTTANAPSLALATDSGNDGADGITHTATVNVNGLEDGATWEYQVDNGSWTAGVGTSFTLSAGAHNYSVRQTDAAGNTSVASEAKPFTLDTTASAPSLALATDSGNDGADSVTNIATVNVNGLEDGATWEYQVDNGSWTTGVGTSFALSAGLHNYSVRQTDAVGNTSLASEAKPFTLDTTASAPSLSLATDSGNDGADGLTRIAAVNVNGLEPGATWEYQVDNGSWTAGVGTGFTLTAGNHNYSVRQTDALGNLSDPSDTKPFTLDTTGPTLTSSYTVAENTSSDAGPRTVTLVGADTNGPVTWSELNGSDKASFSLSANGALTFNEAANYEAKNSYSVTVTGADAAGNMSSQVVTVHVSDVNEAPVVVGAIAPQSAGVNLSYFLDTSKYFSDNDILATGATASYRLLNFAITSGTLPAGLSFNASTGVISGVATAPVPAEPFTVTATDGAGLSVSHNFSLQVVDPSLNVVAADNVINATESSSGLVLSGVSAGYDTVSVEFNNKTHTATVDKATGTWSVGFASYELPTTGSASISVTSATLAGVKSTAVTRTVTMSTAVPNAPAINNIAGGDGVNAAEKAAGVLISGTATSGNTVQVSWGGRTATTTANSSNVWQVTFATAEVPADGSYTVVVKQTDSAGNSASATSPVTVSTTTLPIVGNGLVTHSSATGNASSAATNNSTREALAADSSGVVFSNANAAQFGNSPAAFSETNSQIDLLWWDSITGLQKLISHSSANQHTTSADDSAIFKGMAANGSGVVFSALDAAKFGNSGGAVFTDSQTTFSDLLWWDASTGVQQLITHSSASGNKSSAATTSAVFGGITPDGSAVVFSSPDAKQFGKDDVAFSDKDSGSADLFWWDKAKGDQTLITHSSLSGNMESAAVNASSLSAIANDSSGVVFANNNANNFGYKGVSFTDTGLAAADLFWWDKAKGEQKLITHSSLAGNGASAATGNSTFYALANDSTGVVFSNPDTTQFGNNGVAFSERGFSAQDLFWWDKTTGTQQLITHSSAPGNTNSSTTATPSFASVANDSSGLVFRHTVATQMGNNGKAFTDAGTSATDLFWWDKATGTQQLINHSSAVGNTASEAITSSGFAAISADSAGVVFTNSNATQFGNNGVAFSERGLSAQDLFWWNKATGVQQLITHSSAVGNTASEANTSSGFYGISADSAGVVFSNYNTTQFGNNGVAFTDAGISATDLFWWDKATGEQQLITHSSAASRTDSAAITHSTFVAILPDHSVIFTNVDASQFGNNGNAFVDSNTSATGADYFLWDARTGSIRLLTASATDPNASSGSVLSAATASADGNTLYLSLADVSTLPSLEGTAMVDASTSATDVVAIRLSLLDLVTAQDTGALVYDDITQLSAFTLNGYVKANQAVILKEGNAEQARATANGNGVVVFNLTGVSNGTHSYTLFDATSQTQLSLVAGDLLSRAAVLHVTVDNTAPSPVTVAAVAGDDVVNAAEKAAGVTLSGVAHGAASVSVLWNKVTHTATVDKATGTWSVGFASYEMPVTGSDSVSVTSYSTAGVSSTPVTRTVSMSTALPNAPAINNIAGGDGVNATEKAAGVLISGTATSGNTVQVSWGGRTATTTANSSNVWQVTFATAEVPADGSYAVVVKQTDSAGNSASATSPVTVSTTTLPIVGNGLVTHSSAAGNASSAATSNVVLNGVSSDSSGVLFSHSIANQFGNSPTAFTDTNGQTDLLWWHSITGLQKLISHSSADQHTTSADENATFNGMAANGSGVVFSASNAAKFGNSGEAAFTDSQTTFSDLLWWEASTGVQQLITHSSAFGNKSSAATTHAGFGAIAPNGAGVVFSSPDATQFGQDGAAFSDAYTSGADLFWWDKATGNQSLITHNKTGGNKTSGSVNGAVFVDIAKDSSGVVFSNTNVSGYGNKEVGFTDAGISTTDLMWWDKAEGEQKLITHSSLAGNGESVATTLSSFNAMANDSSGVVFSNVNATFFGNNGTAFVDTALTATDYFWWDKATGTQQLITHSSIAGNTTSVASSGANYFATANDSAGVVFSHNNATQFGNNGMAFLDVGTSARDLFWWDKATGTQQLINHSSAVGNNSASLNGAFFYGMANDSTGVVFSNDNATELGNNGVAFTDAGTTTQDLLWWNKATGVQQLITHSSAVGNTASEAITSSGFSAISADSAGVVFSNYNTTQFGNNGVAFTDAGISATDLFWWDKATGEQQLITHSSAASRTDSAAITHSTFVAILPDHSVIFTNVDASQFGNNGNAFVDSNTSATGADYFLWDARTGSIRLLTASATDPNASSGSVLSAATASADGNTLYLSLADVSTLPSLEGTAMVDASTSATDVVAIRLSLLDLVTAQDTGALVYDDITQLSAFTLNGYVKANQAVILKEGNAEQARATANGNGVVVFNLTGVSNGTHSYTLFDATSQTQLSLVAGDLLSRAAVLHVTVDNTAPSPVTVAAVAGDDVVNAAEKAAGVTLSGVAHGAASVSVLWNKVTHTATVDKATGTWSVGFASYEMPVTGSDSVSVTSYSTAGVSSTPVTRTVSMSTALPNAPAINNIAGGDGVNATEKAAGVLISGTATSGNTVQVSWGGRTATTTANSSNVWQVTFATAEVPADGSYAVVVKQTDSAGNSASATSPVTVSTTTLPIVGNVLVTHSSATGNASSAATTSSNLDAVAANSAGVVFSNANAAQFGNNAVAFTDAQQSTTDLLWWDPATGEQKLITHGSASNSASATSTSNLNAIANDGSGVVFSSSNASKFGNSGEVFTDAQTGVTDLFWWGKSLGVQQLITHSSASLTASAATNESTYQAIASDGSGLVFSNVDATQFGPVGKAFTDTTKTVTDLFWWNKESGEQTLITHSSVANTRSDAAYASTLSDIAKNGSGLVFSNMNATNFGNKDALKPAFTDSSVVSADLFWWDKASGVQQLISHSSVAGNTDSTTRGGAYFNAIANDSSGVVFNSVDATKFGNNDKAFTDVGSSGFTSTDLFWWDKASGVQQLITHSRAAGNTESASTDNANFNAIANDSSGVVFSHNNVSEFGNNGMAFVERGSASASDLFWWDKATGEQTLINHSSAAGNTTTMTVGNSAFNAISADSTGVVFTNSNVAQLGNDGVAFTDWVGTAFDLLWWDKATGVQQLITHSSAAGNTTSEALSSSTFRAISADSAGVVFYNANVAQFGNNGVAFTDTGTNAIDLLWWDRATGEQQLITHSSAVGNTASAAANNSTYLAMLADHSVIFSNLDASKFGNNGNAFVDSNTTVTGFDYFLWDASTGNIRLLSASATDPNASTGSSLGAVTVSADGNTLYASPVDISALPSLNGTAFSDDAKSATDIVAIRLSLLDLTTAYDTGTSAYDNITSAKTFTLNGYVKPNLAVALKDNGVQVATATADGNGTAVFNLSDVSIGAHDYTLFDASGSTQLSLVAGDLISRAAHLSVFVA